MATPTLVPLPGPVRPPPARGIGTRAKVALGCGAGCLVLVLFYALIALMFMAGAAESPWAAEGRRVARVFVESMARGNTRAAYALSSDQFRQVVSKADLDESATELRRRMGQFKDLRFQGEDWPYVRGYGRVQVLTYSVSGSTRNDAVRIQMIKAHTTPRVLRFDFQFGPKRGPKVH